MDMNISYKEIATDCVSSVFDKMDNELGEIISCCETDCYSMKEIVEKLEDLRKKIY